MQGTLQTPPLKTGLFLFVFLIAFLAAGILLMQASKDEFEEKYGMSEAEYQEMLEEAGEAAPPPEEDCPFKLSRAEWDELQAQFERTPRLGDTWAPSGEHYVLVALLNKWKLYPSSAAEALELAEFLLTYCMET